MSTRSIIGTATDSGFEGRYCHCDGYPTVRGRQVFETYHQLGGDLQALITYAIRPGQIGYWSSYLTPEEAKANDALPEDEVCWLCHGTGKREDMEVRDGCNVCSGTGRSANRARYTGWCSDNGDSWATQTEDWGAEWVYLVNESGITVLEGDWSDGKTVWRRIAHVRWTDRPDWGQVECGENFERCSHYAWYHVGKANMPPGTDRLGMQEWLQRNSTHTA